MKKMILFVLFSIFFIFNSCNNVDEIIPKVEADMPDDFNFKINFGTYGKNCIDTYNSTFTKDLVAAGTETIDFVIPTDEMRKIYEAFIEYKIHELPDDINSEIEIIMGKDYTEWEPAANYILTYTYNNVKRTISCNDGGPWYADSGPPETRNNLVKFVEIVSEYIYNTEEYQKMPPFEGGYE